MMKSNWSVRGRKMRELEAERFWLSFCKEDWSSKSLDDLVPFLWAGIPMHENEPRKKLFQLAVQRNKLREVDSGSIKLPKRVSEQIELELGMKSCFPVADVSDDPRKKQDMQDGSELQQRVQLDDSIRDSVRRMMLAHAASSASESYVPGVAHLAALLLETCDKDEELALGVLCRLLSRVSSYFADQQVRLRRDILILSDIIVSDFHDLAEHFNIMEFDVVDLSDCACIWTLPLFVYHFPRQFVLRTIDLVLFEGSSVLLPIIFGVVALSSGHLLQKKDLPSLYRFFSHGPEVMSREQIDNVFSLASDLAADRIRLTALRAEKNWVRTMDLPGLPRFVEGVGTGDPVLSLSASSPDKSIDAIPSTVVEDTTERSVQSESPERVADDAANVLRDRVQMPGTIRGPGNLRGCFLQPSEDEDMIRLQNENTDLQRKLADTSNEVKTQRQHINNLSNKMSSLELQIANQNSIRNQFALTTSAIAVPSQIVRDLRARQTSSTPSSLPPPLESQSRVSVSYDDDVAERYRSMSFSQMHEVFSRVHEVLDFPCIYVEGYLMKLSRAGLFGRRVLHRRWFILKGRYLTYFKTPLHTKPQKDRCASLRGASIGTLSNHPKGEWAITISTVDQSTRSNYLLFASSKEEQEKWTLSLEIAARIDC